MPKIPTRYLVLIMSIALLLSGVAVSSSVQSNFGLVLVTEVDFSAADGSNIHSTLQRPTYATDSNPLPGVVVIHGSLQNKEWLMAFGIELARRGFVVLTIDANGHGNSDVGTGSGTAALEYIASLDFVNSSSLGLIGHSMGGGIAWSAIRDSSIQVNALVLVGSWASTANATYPNNLLVTVGSFDSLVKKTGLSEEIVFDLLERKVRDKGRVVVRRLNSDIPLRPIMNKYFIILDIGRDFTDRTYMYQEVLVGTPRR